MGHHLVSAIIVPATVERVACRYPRFREERRRITSFARGPSHVWALRWRAQHGYFFHADLQATLCFGCGGQYPLHAQMCPWFDYDLPEIRPSTSNLAQEMNINVRPLHGTEPSFDYADVNIRRVSFHQQRALCMHTWTHHLANAGFYAMDRNIVACFCCGVRIPLHILMQALGNDPLGHALLEHIRRSPQCTYTQALSPVNEHIIQL